MTCELLLTTPDGQILAGTIMLDGGQIRAEAVPSHETLLANVLAAPTHDGSKQVLRSDGAAAWFRALPIQYHGSYLRARIV